MLKGQVVHFNALVSFIEYDWPITACDHGCTVLVSSDASHLWVNGADVADLGAPERPILLNIQVFVTLAHLITLSVLLLNVETCFNVGFEVEERWVGLGVIDYLLYVGKV